jgi:hypothetical protein
MFRFSPTYVFGTWAVLATAACLVLLLVPRTAEQLQRLDPRGGVAPTLSLSSMRADERPTLRLPAGAGLVSVIGLDFEPILLDVRFNEAVTIELVDEQATPRGQLTLPRGALAEGTAILLPLEVSLDPGPHRLVLTVQRDDRREVLYESWFDVKSDP